MPHELRVALWLALALLVFYGVARYLRSQLQAAFPWPVRAQQVYGAWLVLVVVSAVLPRFAPQLLGPLAPALGQFSGVSVVGLAVACALLLPIDLARRVWLRLRPARGLQQPTLAAPPADPARRDLLRQGIVIGAAGAGFGGSLYGTLYERHALALETVPIKLAKLPRTLDGFTLVQLSDLHVGQFMDEWQLEAALAMVSRQKPDAIVLTGDLIDHDIRYSERLFRFARALSSRARYGAFAIPGNHDHYVGVSVIEQGLAAAGIEVLTNRHTTLGRGKDAFVLAGLDDVAGGSLSGRGPSLSQAFAGAPPELARVLLSHNPGYFPTSRAFADLTLSGHTHGGQISLFINPAELVLPHGFVRGLYGREGSQLYVNRGFGTAGPPIRIGSTPEVTRLILTV